ncbi:branched-chain amino acid transport system substrate-binding protein [Bradyrhizobium sp. GM2.2]|jgi:branched-chain amino acid transport system substrate-binding protein|uniref:ABC transporter substrate-binding protein n=1 Tax=Bradyrhizobium TaxID=374 RepID=UPI00039D223C|nr:MULTISPECIES: ABC transporter substrate-binding protein [Bradyrhizobium]MBM7484469.1 branched-chain amino acid transport system substrate-binding protein [Bradyrhizobium canariense]MCK1270870.1 ABC transporter substrate-binding protein [Bradyrhizobium sp. 84]MCK1306739.1 ABC transporter substrate-binding protein [Bradyrhizobium sp. 45]MCK1321214.1 ABC transporter substrate-binding protein [Bradyrhizobium sp. 156]MCK1348270.1 ABC transporter substrate-binding protein [Bradyrhizobium sp. CW11
MKKPLSVALRIALGTAAAAVLMTSGAALAADPIRIGVIAEAQAIAGASIPQAAQLAADEINANGGVDGRKIEIVSYDNHSSSADSVRAFQRAVNEDKVNAVIASYISEVVLALEPWASRLKTPFVTPGAASNEISKSVHADYEKNKYTFHGYLTSAALALSVCDGAKDLLVDKMHMKTAVIMSEDAAWTKPLDIGYEECLPKIGLKVLDHIRFSPDTTDFTPIFNKIEGSKPDVIITGISHVGVQPTVQWKNQQVPIPMFGISSQATNETFGKDTNQAAEGVLYQGVSGPGVAVTPKSVPFAEAFKKKFGNYPSYAGYTAYDEVYYIADAVKRAGSTDADKLVAALETTDWEGTIGRVQFYGKDDPFTHSIKYGKGLITGLMLQWQDGKQSAVWPKEVAKVDVKFPSFIKLSN